MSHWVLILATAGWKYALAGAAIFVASFAFSLLVIGILLVHLPPTYFLDRHARQLWVDQHPVVRYAGLLIKNITGAGLILLGIALSMPLVPGQGLLTILIGLILLDFPGKRRLERWILQRRHILPRVNRLRQRYHRPPLQLDEPRQPDNERPRRADETTGRPTDQEPGEAAG